MSAESLPCPPGYQAAVPFDKDKHRRLGIDPHAQRFARVLHLIYLSHLEVGRACLDYPVAFAERARHDYVPVAVTGTEPGTNLFVDGAGDWEEHLYCPAYVRRYPFFLARIDNNDGRGLICVDESALTRQGPELLNTLGEPTALWEDRQRLIEQMDVAEHETTTICRRLFEYGLFEPFEADFHPTGKAPKKLSGLTRIASAQLNKLEPQALKDMVGDGTMKLIDAHLLSLQRFDRLLNRDAAL